MLKEVYPIAFDVAAESEVLTWLDIDFYIENISLSWHHRDLFLPPVSAVPRSWYRSYCLGRTTRWKELELEHAAICEAVAHVIYDLKQCGLAANDFRYLYHSTRGCKQHFHLKCFLSSRDTGL